MGGGGGGNEHGSPTEVLHFVLKAFRISPLQGYHVVVVVVAVAVSVAAATIHHDQSSTAHLWYTTSSGAGHHLFNISRPTLPNNESYPSVGGCTFMQATGLQQAIDTRTLFYITCCFPCCFSKLMNNVEVSGSCRRC